MADDKKVQQLKNADPELWTQVRAVATLEGKTMTEWVEELVREKLAGMEIIDKVANSKA